MKGRVKEKYSIDQFEILRELGRGGSSIVYLVSLKESGGQFAMKCLKPQYVIEEFPAIAAECLRTEAQILVELNGIPASDDMQIQAGIPAFYGEVYDHGIFTGFLMEYVEGVSLKELLDKGRIFTIREATEAGLWLCSVLVRLHEMDPPRIYRDLKPGNILVRGDGQYVLVDYGAVRAFRDGVSKDTHPLGTEGYAAPEQYGGWEQSDRRTDLYGVGAVLHHMLTGRTPVETGLRPLTELMEGLQDQRQYAEMDKILRRACSVAPSMRYPSCREFEKALRRLCVSERENTRKKLILLTRIAAAFLAVSGLFGATAYGYEMNRYYALIREAEEMGNTEEGKNDSIGEDGKNVRSEDRNGIPEEQIDILQQAVKIRPRDPEAYLSLLRWLSSDGVLTQYEKEVMENFLYENGYPGKMREWRPAKYAGLEMELGKVYFGCYEGGTEAALRAFGNAAEAAGIGSRDRKFARAMCEVLGGEWTAGRVGAWEFLIEAAVAEAMKTGDGRFAASVCSRAAGEIALFPDRLAAAGADREDVREVADEVRKFAQALEDGWPEVPDETASELQTAAEAAVRVCSGGFWELPAEG